MLKKSIAVSATGFVLVMSLVGCRRVEPDLPYDTLTPEMPIIGGDYDGYYDYDDNYYDDYDYEYDTNYNDYYHDDYGFTIERIGDADIAELGYYNEFRYSDEPGEHLLVRFTNPVTNFNLLNLYGYGDDDISVTERLDGIGDITPDRPLLIRNYRWSGVSFPRQGFSFTGENGENKYHRWDVSAMDGELRWERFDWADY